MVKSPGHAVPLTSVESIEPERCDWLGVGLRGVELGLIFWSSSQGGLGNFSLTLLNLLQKRQSWVGWGNGLHTTRIASSSVCCL